jgi:hypothetical protein
MSASFRIRTLLNGALREWSSARWRLGEAAELVIIV